MPSNDSAFLHLAEAVADAADVDWASVESSASDADESHVIRQLRRLADISRAARACARPGDRSTSDPNWGVVRSAPSTVPGTHSSNVKSRSSFSRPPMTQTFPLRR